MKRIIVSILAIVSFVAMSCGTAETADGSKSTQVQDQKSATFTNASVTDLNGAIEKGEDIIILDVRTPGEFSQGYIENAILMDINNASFRSKAAELDKSKIIYVYCRSGHRSQTASKALIDMGYPDVINVEGGFIAWTQKNYKSVK